MSATAPEISIEEGRYEELRPKIQRFTWQLAIILGVLALLPNLLAWISQRPGTLYLGSQYALDDHMVYAAWMRQAMEGRFLFDNRFATDPQPGLTIHLYYLGLGWIAQLVTIPVATTLARVGFSVLFVLMLGRLLIEHRVRPYMAMGGLVLACLGGGIGYLMWTPFGRLLPEGHPLAPLSDGRLPIDVWQPEAFVFPSMLANGLFMVSLCLILAVIGCVLRARESWRPVLPGALAMAALMNIHSYDVLLVTLVLIGFLVASSVAKRVKPAWILRAVVIGAGALPPAFWFLHVLQQDAVFQARAATLTYSPTFRQVLLGVFPLAILAVAALWAMPIEAKRRNMAAGGLGALIFGLYALSGGASDSAYFLNPLTFGVVFLLALGLVALGATDDDWMNLVWAWAIVGLVVIYFPALFQRKLAMGLAIPWGLLGAYGLFHLLRGRDASTRNLAGGLAVVVSCLSSILWLQREFLMVRNDVSSTTVHPVVFTQDVRDIVDILNREPAGRRVALAMPGVPFPQENPAWPFATPYLPDLNAVLSGMTGVYSYAGHWSETPEYDKRRGEATTFFLTRTSDDMRRAFLADKGVTHLVAPDPVAFPEVPLADVTPLGEVVHRGNQFVLIRIEPAAN